MNITWGASTSAYQIEGAWNQDGKGPSIWDAYCREDGKILHGDRGDVACDHYNRYKEDVGLMKDIGLQSYRFSISWPRVMPNGTGAVNAKGLEFYDKLVDELLAQGIDPLATLFHWDYPLALLHRGGCSTQTVQNGMRIMSPLWLRNSATASRNGSPSTSLKCSSTKAT